MEFVLFLIEWSKSNQNFKRELWVPVKPAKDRLVCLVYNLKSFFERVMVDDNSPCFSFHNDKKELKALTYGQLNEQIKIWVSRTGRQGNKYTTHCLRRGGINHALRCGISPEYL